MELNNSCLKLVKGAEVYAPEYLGIKDILIADDKIARISDVVEINYDLLDVYDASGMLVVPGFIDNHVHIVGGGGEGGFKTRTPEIMLRDIIISGVTSVVGCLGTDGYSRTLESLLAKARGLEAEGISTYIYTGSYSVPPITITGNVVRDIMIVDKVIGVGEIAISDHRSSQPTFDELVRVAAEARLGGILSGKAGVVNVHVGDGAEKLKLLEEIVEKSEIPAGQFLVTHIGRSPELIEAAIRFAQRGGMVDLTTSTKKVMASGQEAKTSQVFSFMIKNGAPLENISFSSDGQGSLPKFDEKGNFLYLGVGKVRTLFEAFRDCVIEEEIPISDSLKPVTENPARFLKLEGKGKIKEGFDADLLILEKGSLEIDTVMAKGKFMIREKKILVKGTFENDEGDRKC